MRNLIGTAVLAAAVLTASSGGPAAAGPSACASMGGTIERGQICHLHASAPTYILDMAFPVDYPDQQALNAYLTQTRDGFLNVAQMSGPRDQPYQLDATAKQHRSGPPARGTHSVVLKFFQDLGGARPSTWYQAFNYHLEPGRPVTFDTLFAPDTAPLDTIYPIVARELERQTGLGGTISPGVGRDPAHYQNFAITDQELIFYFAPGELLPPVAGATQARVPRGAIPPLTV